MANPVKTLPGEQLLVQIGDGATPEVFAHPCFINADRGIQLSADTTEIIVPDCDDLALPAFKEILKDGLSMQITGGGVLNTTDLEAWFNWMISDTAKNCRVRSNVAVGLGGGYIAGAFKITGLNLTGTRKNNTTVEVTLMSHGQLAWTDA